MQKNLCIQKTNYIFAPRNLFINYLKHLNYGIFEAK